MPILRAVPAIIEQADSKEEAFKSTIFVLAISSICACVILATLVLLGTALPLSIPQAF